MKSGSNTDPPLNKNTNENNTKNDNDEIRQNNNKEEKGHRQDNQTILTKTRETYKFEKGYVSQK